MKIQGVSLGCLSEPRKIIACQLSIVKSKPRLLGTKKTQLPAHARKIDLAETSERSRNQ